MSRLTELERQMSILLHKKRKRTEKRLKSSKNWTKYHLSILRRRKQMSVKSLLLKMNQKVQRLRKRKRRKLTTVKIILDPNTSHQSHRSLNSITPLSGPLFNQVQFFLKKCSNKSGTESKLEKSFQPSNKRF